jgi:hypothetical protein
VILRLAAAAAAVVGGLAEDPRVTIEARPNAPRWGTPVVLFGALATGKANELITIEVKECGRHAPFFRAVAAVRTGDGGAWSTQAFLRTNSAFRVRWADATSAAVTVQARPAVQLSRRSGRLFDVGVRALVPFRARHVIVQRYDRRLGSWVGVKTVVLTETGSAGGFVGTGAAFRLVVPNGTLLRAVFPRSQARPCYIAGYSNLLRT